MAVAELAESVMKLQHPERSTYGDEIRLGVKRKSASYRARRETYVSIEWVICNPTPSILSNCICAQTEYEHPPHQFLPLSIQINLATHGGLVLSVDLLVSEQPRRRNLLWCATVTHVSFNEDQLPKLPPADINILPGRDRSRPRTSAGYSSRREDSPPTGACHPR